MEFLFSLSLCCACVSLSLSLLFEKNKTNDFSRDQSLFKTFLVEQVFQQDLFVKGALSDSFSFISIGSMSLKNSFSSSIIVDRKERKSMEYALYYYYYYPSIPIPLLPHNFPRYASQPNSMINDRIPRSSNMWKNSSWKLRRCVSLFLHLIGWTRTQMFRKFIAEFFRSFVNLRISSSGRRFPTGR